MSVQGEIDTLTVNLAATNAAIEAAGGTASTTGTSGLAEAIASIPTGGGGMVDPVTDYGAILYYSGVSSEYKPEQMMDCTVTIFNSTLLEQWMTNQGVSAPLDFYMQYGAWMCSQATGSSVYDMTELGVSVTTTSEWASFRIKLNTVVDKTSPIIAYEIPTTTQLSAFSGSSGDSTRYFHPTGADIYASSIVRFVFGTETITLPENFLNATSIESISEIPEYITAIPNGFLVGSRQLNTEIKGLEHVTSIGNGFLASSVAFNQPLTLTAVTSIGNSFLMYGTAFNQDISLPNCTTIGSQFLMEGTKFNSYITFPKITSIGGSFLQKCSRFNCPLPLPSTLTTISYSFLASCTAFNQALDLSHITSIGDSFLSGGGMAFNQPVNMPNVTTIGKNFLSHGTGSTTYFNSPISMPAVVDIGQYFLKGAAKFNQNLTIPSTVQTIGDNFMYNCQAMTSTLTVEVAGITTGTNDKYTLANYQNTAPSYATGITLAGTYASDWATKFPNSNTNPYRKLIVASS